MSKPWLFVACLLAILAGTALVYLPGLHAYFVADDFRYLELAGQVHSLGDIAPHVQGACTRVGWPVVILAFWLGRILGGLQPEPYRLLALGVHLLNALLVFVLVRRMGGARSGVAALAAALVLALHPRQHESVLWLSTLTWSVGTTLSLLAAISYTSWRRSGGWPWLAGALAALALAMISSPAIIVLPVIFAAYDLLFKRARPASLALWLAMLAIVGLLGVVCGLGGLPNSGDRASYGLGLSGVTHAVVFLTYTLWPVPLNLKEIIAASPLAGYLSGGVALALVMVAGAAILQRGTALARWGIAWTLLAVLPPAFFSAFLSDHYMSLMLVGVALTCAGVVQGLAPRWTRCALLVAAIWVIGVTPQTALKLRDWQAASALTAAVRDETLARYPQVTSGTRFVYIGLPEVHNRAVIWTYGIDSAVRVWYNNPAIYAVKDIEFGVRYVQRPDDVIMDFSGQR